MPFYLARDFDMKDHVGTEWLSTGRITQLYSDEKEGR